MWRNLLRFGFAVALLSGGWGGVLVAAACPHAGAQSHACCHRNAKTDPPHCHEDGGAQPTGTSHGERHDASPHAGRADEHHSDANYLDAALSTLSTAQPSTLCSHCLSRPVPQRTSAETREPGRARHEASSPAPRTQGRTIFYSASLTRVVVPLEHATPPTARRHVLLGLFLI